MNAKGALVNLKCSRIRGIGRNGNGQICNGDILHEALSEAMLSWKKRTMATMQWEQRLMVY